MAWKQQHSHNAQYQDSCQKEANSCGKKNAGNKAKQSQTGNWVGHIARMDNDLWTKIIMEWRPRKERKGVGRPPFQWVDEIRKLAGKQWHRLAQNRNKWKTKTGFKKEEERRILTHPDKTLESE
ncbi:hypothetical protein ILUMI_02417 [Ignelater luminosus]|uniref:Uncharacterized protein n=1 Tax=Ignelater luminosus TaxID=2038154 RepID=A0A8K0DDG6_IGNLU|nr:hypothetical protein ILUMI_02417 [Ignelater luminosus]